MSEKYSKAKFTAFGCKPGSAIDEQLYNRVVAVVDCKNNNISPYDIYTPYDPCNKANPAEPSFCLDPKNELYTYEHFGSSNKSYMKIILVLVLIAVLFYFLYSYKKEVPAPV